MPALPPPFGEMPRMRVDDAPEDLSAQALRDDPFAHNSTLAASVGTGQYSPRLRLSSRPPPPYVPPQPPPSAASAAATELPFASARYPPGPNLALQGRFAPAPGDPSLPTTTRGVASSAFPAAPAPTPEPASTPTPTPVPASTGRDAPPFPGRAPIPPVTWTQVPMQTYDLTLAAPRSLSPTPAATVPDKRLMDDPLEQQQQPQLHRRRQFKYLTDEPAPPPSTKDAKPPEQHESRKKVKRACVYCKRSHMPCDISRPCKRCVKRGIAHLCKDEPPTEAPGPRKRKDASAPRASTERRASLESERTNVAADGSHPPSAASESEPRKAPARMMLPISLLLTDSPPSRRPSSPARERHESASELELGRTSSRGSSISEGRLPDAQQVDANGEMQKLMGLIDPKARKLVEAILNGAGAKDLPGIEAVQNIGESSDRMLLRTNAVQEEALTLAVMRARPDEPWTWGYTSLAKWMRENYTKTTTKLIDSYIGQIRQRYLSRSVGMTREELQAAEEATMLSISHYRLSVFESVPHGMFICSRTGRLMAINMRLLEMLQLPEEVINSGNFYYFYMISDPQVVPIARAYLNVALNLGADEKGKDPDPSGGSRETVNGTNSLTLCHDFDVDRARTLRETPAWDYATGTYLPDAPRELDDGTPSVVHFKGLVTIQARTHETSREVPLFLVAYVSEPPLM